MYEIWLYGCYFYNFLKGANAHSPPRGEPCTWLSLTAFPDCASWELQRLQAAPPCSRHHCSSIVIQVPGPFGLDKRVLGQVSVLCLPAANGSRSSVEKARTGGLGTKGCVNLGHSWQGWQPAEASVGGFLEPDPGFVLEALCIFTYVLLLGHFSSQNS